MTWLPLLLMLLAGLFLSAFFSGCETGFYRATRVKLVLDALDGDPISRGLLWLTNNPSLFVATTLIGNNAANYLTTLALVLLTKQLFRSDLYLAELILPVAAAPIIFVYGELLPKNLFYYAPNRLLRRSGALFLLFGVLFAPLAALLWGLGRCLRWVLGESPEQVQLKLARQELQQVFQEGQDVGILKPAQRSLAQHLFSVAAQPVSAFCTPTARVASIHRGASKADALRLARRQRASALPIAAEKGRELIGYVRVVDLYLNDSETVDTIRPFLDFQQTETHSAALMRMQSEKESLARVIDEQGNPVGLLYAKALTEPLFRGT